MQILIARNSGQNKDALSAIEIKNWHFNLNLSLRQFTSNNLARNDEIHFN